MDRANRVTPTSAFHCRARARRPRHRYSSMVKRPSPCAGIRSRRISSGSSTVMSNAGMDAPDAPSPAEAAAAVKDQARFGRAFLQTYGWRLLLVFAGVLLPLWAFGVMAD